MTVLGALAGAGLATGAAPAAAQPPWTAPEPITSGVAANPSLAVDAGGDAFALWTAVGSGSGGARPVLEAAERPFGGAWSRPHVLSESGIYPAVAADPAGEAIAVWRAVDATAQIRAARWQPDSGWIAQAPLSAGAGAAADVAMGDGGQAIAAWVSLRSRPGAAPSRIQVSFAAPDGEFGVPLTLAGSDYAASPVAATNSQGDAVVAWQAGSRSSCVIRAAYAYPGIGFGRPHTVSDASASCAATQQVALDAAGVATVVWIDRHGRRRSDVQSMTRAPSGQWTARTTLARGVSSAPRLAADADGESIVAFTRAVRGHSAIMAATRFTSGSWHVSAVAGGRGGNPVVAIDDAGDALAVWDHSGTLAAAVRRVGGAWRSLSPIAADLPLAGSAAALLDAQGDALVGWRERDGLVSSTLPGLFG